MTEQEFLQKYGTEKVYFSYIHRYSAMFVNEDLKIWCSCDLEYSDDISFEEMVNSIFDLGHFQFGLIS